MKPTILLPGTLPADLIARLGEAFTLHQLLSANQAHDIPSAMATEIRGIATRSMVGANARLIGQLPNLEIISIFGVGCDAVDLDAARRRGIKVTNTPDVLTEDTAEYAIALMLALARRVVQGDRFVRQGKWLTGSLPTSVRLRGRRLGVVGMGRIGQGVAHRAKLLSMDVQWHGPRAKPELPYTYHPALVDLAKAADFLVLTCPGGPMTERMINRTVLAALGQNGFLINIARGSVVDENDLVSALRDGTIAGAALDVFQNEPNVPAELLAFDNVILEPHIASTTVETRQAIGELMQANLAAHFAGRPLISPVC